MMIESRVEATTESGRPERTGFLHPLRIPFREKLKDALPELQSLSKFDASCTRLRSRSRVEYERLYHSEDLFSEEEIEIVGIGKPRVELRTWVPSKQKQKIVHEPAKLSSRRFGQQTGVWGNSMQSGAVGHFDNPVCFIHVSDMKTGDGTSQVCSAIAAEHQSQSRNCAERQWIVLATFGTTVSERAFVNMATKQSGEDPIPTNMHRRLSGYADWTESIAKPLVA
jgi:hypothetical protein